MFEFLPGNESIIVHSLYENSGWVTDEMSTKAKNKIKSLQWDNIILIIRNLKAWRRTVVNRNRRITGRENQYHAQCCILEVECNLLISFRFLLRPFQYFQMKVSWFFFLKIEWSKFCYGMAGMTPLVKTKDAQLIFTREDDMIYYLYVYKATHTHNTHSK